LISRKTKTAKPRNCIKPTYIQCLQDKINLMDAMVMYLYWELIRN